MKNNLLVNYLKLCEKRDATKKAIKELSDEHELHEKLYEKLPEFVQEEIVGQLNLETAMLKVLNVQVAQFDLEIAMTELQMFIRD